jgi:hypothetical protein
MSRHIGWPRWFLFFLLSMASAGCGDDTPPPPPPPPAPDVSNDQANAGGSAVDIPLDLPNHVEFAGYRLKLPQGLAQIQPSEPQHDVSMLWQGVGSDESTKLSVTLAIDDSRPNADLAAELLERLQRDPKAMAAEAKPESAEVGGLKGFRASYDAKSEGDAASKAVLYLLLNQSETVLLSIFADGANAEAHATLMDAVAHSLEKPEGESLAALGTPYRTVTLQLAPMQEFGAPFVSDALKEIVGPNAKIEPQNQGSTFQFTIKPRIDIEDLAKRIGFGKVTNIDWQQRQIAVEADTSKVPQDPTIVANDPTHVRYVAQNVEFLSDPNPERRQGAFDRLTAPDVKIPAEEATAFARAMRTRAFDKQEPSDRRVRALEAMVRSAGAFSVPLVCQLLEENDATIRQAALQRLTELKDERSIEPVAKLFFSRPEDRESAKTLLLAFGPAAEDAVLKLAPNDTPENIRPVLALLTEIGTRKSVRYLTQLRGKRQLVELLPDLNNATKAINDRKEKRPARTQSS